MFTQNSSKSRLGRASLESYVVSTFLPVLSEKSGASRATERNMLIKLFLMSDINNFRCYKKAIKMTKSSGAMNSQDPKSNPGFSKGMLSTGG